jgi:protein gp37
MSSASKTEWTEVTWNPTTGCDRISAGCDHCHVLTLAKRLKATGQAKYQNGGDPRTSGPGCRQGGSSMLDRIGQRCDELAGQGR